MDLGTLVNHMICPTRQLLAAGLHESGSGSKLRLLDLQQNKIDKPGKAALQRAQERVGGGSGEGLAVNY